MGSLDLQTGEKENQHKNDYFPQNLQRVFYHLEKFSRAWKSKCLHQKSSW